MLEKKDEGEIGERERKQDEKSPPAPESEAEQQPAHQYQVGPMNFEARQVIGENCAARQQQCNSPQPERHCEIAQHFADRGGCGGFLDDKFVAPYQIHATSTVIKTSRLRCIRAIPFF